jgi:hypothetical protein
MKWCRIVGSDTSAQVIPKFNPDLVLYVIATTQEIYPLLTKLHDISFSFLIHYNLPLYPNLLYIEA